MDDHYAHDLLNTCKLHTGFLVPVYIVTLSTISGCAGFTTFHAASLRHSLSSGFQIVSPFTLLDSQLFQLPFALLFRIAIGASGIGSPSTLESRSTPEGPLSPLTGPSLSVSANGGSIPLEVLLYPQLVHRLSEMDSSFT